MTCIFYNTHAVHFKSLAYILIIKHKYNYVCEFRSLNLIHCGLIYIYTYRDTHDLTVIGLRGKLNYLILSWMSGRISLTINHHLLIIFQCPALRPIIINNLQYFCTVYTQCRVKRWYNYTQGVPWRLTHLL